MEIRPSGKRVTSTIDCLMRQKLNKDRMKTDGARRAALHYKYQNLASARRLRCLPHPGPTGWMRINDLTVMGGDHSFPLATLSPTARVRMHGN